MIYVCIPSHNEADTVGLLLWKIRKVFAEFGREYQLLVADDASTDRTAETLAGYAKVLPLTVVRHQVRQGYAASVQELLRIALERTDRPKRDCALLMHADFTHGPEFIPDMVKRIDSGADLVVGEGHLQGEPSRGYRMLRRWAPMLLRPAVHIPGVADTVSGFLCVRLGCLRLVMKGSEGPLLTTDGWAANAELLARLAPQARRIETIPTVERHDLRHRPSRVRAWDEAKSLWGSRRALRLAAAAAR